MLNILQWKRRGPFTATAGTPIVAMVDPNPLRGRTIITRLGIQTGATAQTLTVLQVKKKFNMTADAASGQAVIVLDDVTGVATGHYVALRIAGRYVLFTVASVNAGAKEVTLASNLTVAVPAKTPVAWFSNAAGGHEQLPIGASAHTIFESGEGYFGANEMGDPIIFHINNATNAATITAINCPVISV
jgi:hypothetical protein